MIVEPVFRETFDCAALAAAHPPRWRNLHKKAIYERVMQAGPEAGSVEASRWRMHRGVGASPVGLPNLRIVRGFFDYAPEAGASWWMNFADPTLFFAYHTALLAQDELQVLEHPILASLCEAFKRDGRRCDTVEEDWPTPVVFWGVPRRLSLQTGASAEEGRPQGLYGNRFNAAPLEAVLRAVSILTPPTRSNIVAIAAPSPGRGTYSIPEITQVWNTAAAGFASAKAVSAIHMPEEPVRLHTGFWGCGAFGGNREFMTLMQLAAAYAAGIDEVVFHVPDAEGEMPVREAMGAIAEFLRVSGTVTHPALIAWVQKRGYSWGVSDGT